LGLIVGRANADESCGTAPWLLVRSEGLSPALQNELVAQIRSSLAAREMTMCVSAEAGSPGGAPPLAELDVKSADDAVATSIQVNDGVTHKRVARDLDLRGVPADGRTLAIALAIDELLRASWAELMLRDREPAVPVPEVVTKAITPPRREAPERAASWDVGVAAAAEHFGEGQDQLGGDVVGAFTPWSRVGFEGRLGIRSGFAVDATRGEIRSSGLLVGAGVSVALVPRSARVGLDLFGEAILERVTFVADASMTDVRGHEKSLWAFYPMTGLRCWVLLGQTLRAFVRVGGGVPFHTAYATDGATRITGLGGPLVGGALGVSWIFR
jgi:hypothetical protein